MTLAEESRQDTSPEIGKARRRKEDQRLITGRTRWTDNIQLPGMLHVAMVRSPFAHARITAIDTSAAKDAPNVVAVVTGREVAGEQGTMITAWPITTEQKTPEHPPIAVDRVTFAGEVVAASANRTMCGTCVDDHSVICSPVGSHTKERGSMKAGMSRCWRYSRSRTIPPSRAVAMASSTELPLPCSAESSRQVAEVFVPRSGWARTVSCAASRRSRAAGSSS